MKELETLQAQNCVLQPHFSTNETGSKFDTEAIVAVEPTSFKARIADEFINGSAIAPDLFEAAIEFIEDLGRWEPNYALNHLVSRQWQTRRPHNFGTLAALRNEDGTLWQGKPEHPRWDAKKERFCKYEAPSGSGSRAYLPQIPIAIRQKISIQYSVNFPSDGSFWDFVEAHPEIPIVFTEGAKKSLCLLSHGHVAIAGFGCYGFHVSTERIHGEKVRKLQAELTADAKRFAVPGRRIVIAMDSDANPKTVSFVSKAILGLGKLLTQAGCEVSIVSWDGEDGRCKGVDDLIVNCGVEAWESALESALSFDQWQRQRYVLELWRLSFKPALRLNQRYLGAIAFPESGLACVNSPKGTGKTQALVPLVREASSVGRKVLVITHRIQLGRAICEAVGVDWIEDVRESEVQGLLGFGLCVDSLHENSQAAFDPDAWNGAIVILDETEQVLWHLLNSSTCKKERIRIITTLRQLLRNVVATGGLIIAQDADLSDVSINFLRGQIGQNAPLPWVVLNEWQDESTAWTVNLFETKSPSEALLSADEILDLDGKIFVACDSQKARSTWGSKNLERYFTQKHPGKRILRIDSESVSDPNHPAYGCAKKINEIVQSFDIVIATPTIGTGVSIDVRGHFSAVFGIFQGGIPESEARQALGRVRENLPRYVWARSMGLGRIGNGSQFPSELIRSTQRVTAANLQLLKDADLLDLDLDDPASMIDAVCFKTWAKMAARINSGMPRYRESLADSLANEGHNVVRVGSTDEDAAQLIKAAVKEIRSEAQIEQALSVAESEQIDDQQYEALKNKRAKNESERLQQRKYELQKLYGVEVSPDLHIRDEARFYSKIRLHYLLMRTDSQIAEQADVKQVGEMLVNGDGKTLYLPDLTPRTARVRLLVALGVPDLIDPSRGEIRATDDDIASLVEKFKAHRRTIKDVLGLGFSDKVLEKPMQCVQLLLDKIGFKARSKRVRSESGLERVYTVPTPQDERWQIFQNWDKRRDSVSEFDTVCSNPKYIVNKQHEGWNNKAELTPEEVLDIREMWLSAPDEETRELLKATFPPELLAAVA